MHVCMYVCNVNMCVCMYICMYVCMYVMYVFIRLAGGRVWKGRGNATRPGSLPILLSLLNGQISVQLVKPKLKAQTLPKSHLFFQDGCSLLFQSESKIRQTCGLPTPQGHQDNQRWKGDRLAAVSGAEWTAGGNSRVASDV